MLCVLLPLCASLSLVAAVSTAAVAAVVELLPLPRARVRPGLVENGVDASAPMMRMCTSACARLGLHGSVQASGAG